MRGLVPADLLRAELAGSATDRIASLVARCQALPRTGDNRNSPAHTKEIRLRSGRQHFTDLLAWAGPPFFFRPFSLPFSAERGPFPPPRTMPRPGGPRPLAREARPPPVREPSAPSFSTSAVSSLRACQCPTGKRSGQLAIPNQPSGRRRSSKTTPDKGWVGLWLTASARRAARRLRA